MTGQPNLSRIIADHVAALRHEDLRASTLRATRRSLVDALGVMIAASALAQDALPYRRLAEREPGPCRLIGSDRRAGPLAAALANGALAHALDFGDTFDAGPAHPNAALVPALLALADLEPEIDMARFETAMVAGADLACRLSLAPGRPYEEGGWYPPPLVNLVAGAAAAAKLLDLPADGIRHAMGLALMQGAFPGEIKYDPLSPLRGVREGFAARGAVEAALLARVGATAFEDPLGGRAGFFALYGGGAPKPALVEALGTRFHGEAVSFKPWPACRGTHAYIEAALALRKRATGRTIRAIEAEIGPVQEMLILPLAAKQRPRAPIEARFSIPYTVALALHDGAATLDGFAPDRLADPALLSLSALTTATSIPTLTRHDSTWGALKITFDDGAVDRREVAKAIGHPDRPLSDEVLLEKCFRCVAAAPGASPFRDMRDLAPDLLDGLVSNVSHW